MISGIYLKNVSFAYEENRAVLNNLSLEIKEGSFVGILGSNGSGKTTFSYLLNGLIPHYIKGKLTGEILIDGISTRKKNVAFFAQKVGMVFQNPDFSLFNLTVEEEIEFGLNNLKIKNIKEKVKKALEAVGMTSYLTRDPQTLSLGEKQKVALACLLAVDTKYLVLDEPIAQLDYQASLEIYNILNRLNKEGKTVITIEHDTDFLLHYAQEIIIIDKGKIILYGPVKKAFQKKELFYRLGLKLPKV